MTNPYMNDYFFTSNPNQKYNRSKSSINIFNNERPSLFNLSGSDIIYNSNGKKRAKAITSQLKSSNFLAHQQLDEINNDYNNMKDLLNNKISKLEEQQEMQFDSIKNYLRKKNMIEDMKYREQYNDNFYKDLKDQMDFEYYKRKDMDRIRRLNYKEKIDKRKQIENKERKKFLEDMDYFQKIQQLNQMERMVRQKNFMQKRMDDMYKHRFLPPPFGYNMSLAPYLYDLIKQENSNYNNQNDLMKLFLLKSIFTDEKPENKNSNLYRSPKYLIQKYYASPLPASIIPQPQPIPIPQPILFQSPEQRTPQIIIQREQVEPKEIIIPSNEKRVRKRESPPSIRKKEHKHRHKHRHRHKHKERRREVTPPRITTPKTNKKKTEPEEESEEKQPTESKEEESEKSGPEEKEKSEKSEEEKQEESEKPEEEKKQTKDDEEESSSQPEIRLRLFDPDNPESSKIVYPANNNQN